MQMKRFFHEWAPPLLLGVAGMLIAFWPMIGSGFTRMQSDPGDTRHLNYVLEHVYQWMRSHPGFENVWAPAIFYPEPNTGAYTELLLGVAPFYMAWRAVGLAPDSAFQAWMLTMGTLNFVVAWNFLRHPLGVSSLAASAGAFVFAFGSARLNQLNHQHLLPQFFTLIAVHAAVRVFQSHLADRPRQVRLWMTLFFAAFAAQLYSGVYFGWFFGFVLALVAIWGLALPTTRPVALSFLRRHGVALGVATACSIAVLAPMLSPYLAAGKAVGYRDFSEAVGMVPRAHSWFYMGDLNWLYGWWARHAPFNRLPAHHEHAIGLGLVLAVVVVVTLWRERHRPFARLLGLGALTLIVLVTLYRGGVTPWRIVFEIVPGANALRAVSRIGMLMLIPAAVALAWFVERARTTERRRVRYALFGVAAFCLVEQGMSPHSYDKQAYRDRVARLAAAIDPSCRSFLFVPNGSPHGFEETQLDAMWVQLTTGRPTVNGYSSNFPRGWELLDHRLRTEEDRGRLQTALAKWVRERRLSADAVCWIELPVR